MDFHQFYLGCLAHASYLIASDGEAAVVDPQRDVDQYIEEAARRGVQIRYIIETHLHADFVSGHRELAARTGAEIVFGARAGAEFPHRAVRDGDVLHLGSIELKAMETPGHTPESISWLLVDGGEPRKILTGDTLFIGDVGRPDLAGGKGYTPQAMAAMLYDSLHEKILTLPDDVEVWPAHGAGSSCGRSISRERSSTIGVQRRTNYALRPMSRDEFVTMMTADLPEAPPYFSRDAEINRLGAQPLSDVDTNALTVDDVRAWIDRGAIVLDVRDDHAFGAGHLPGSINIGLGGQFASWSGTLLPLERPLVIVADGEERAREAVMRLARVGIENAAGYLDGGVAAWAAAGQTVAELPQITVSDVRDGHYTILDVRRDAEFSDRHIEGAHHVPLHLLQRRIREVPESRPLAVICGGGYRSSMAASILAREGMNGLANVTGGMAAWAKLG